MYKQTSFTPDIIDVGTLTPPVRSFLNRDTAEVVDWKHESLQGASHTSQTFRFSGIARSGNETLPWSLMLKIIRSPDGTDDPASPEYWMREALVYDSGLLNNVPGSLCPPRCFQITKQPNLETWLWLEEIVDEMPAAWPLAQFGTVARNLGQFNGAYINQQAKLTEPWLAKGRLRKLAAAAAPIMPAFDSLIANPLAARVYPGDVPQRLHQVWLEHESWLGFIESQPQTLSHLDAFRRNILTRHDAKGDLQTTLIDWAYVGSAAPGEEIAPLVAASLGFMEVNLDQAGALDKIVFENYIDGLRQAGWQGDPRVVRFTYAAACVLRYSVGVAFVAAMLNDKSQHIHLEQAFGHPLEQLVDVWGGNNLFLYDLADEARELFNSFR